MLYTEAATRDISSHASMYHHSLVLSRMARRTCLFDAITGAAHCVHGRFGCEVIRATRLSQELLLAARR